MNRFKLYAFIQNTTPPFLFKWFRNSILYKWALKVAKKIDRPIPSEESIIKKGALEGYVLFLNPSGSWQKTMLNGTYDEELFAYISKNFQLEGKNIYDIGGHIGYHSLMFSKMIGDEGHVYTFEPNPANVERIEKITSLNPSLQKNIKIFNCALSDHSGTSNFLSTQNIEGGTSSGGFIDNATPLWKKSVYTEKTGFSVSEVKIKTIDELVKLKEMNPPHLMKVDVEGAEHLVLSGAKNTIEQYRPIIFVELHSIYASYSTTTLLLEHDYKTTVVEKEVDGRIMLLAKPS